jgi:hypothetical protein
MKHIIEVVKKNLKVVVGIALVAIAGFSANALTKKDIAPVEENIVPSVIEQPEVVAPSRPTGTKPAPVAPTVTDTRGYAELIVAYKGKTLQFGASCQVVMSTQGFKVGSQILLDNRNATPVTIKLGTAGTYTLGGYGYKVVTLATPGNFMVDCNSQQNVATLSVQK